MHPEILHWGVVHIRSYGLLLAVAFLVGTWLALRDARRRQLDEDKVITVILAALIAGVLGARALYVIEHITEFRHGWMGVLALWQGGLTLYGGVIAGAVVGLLAARQAGLPMWIVADALTPSVALGTGFGRIGCYLNGCCYGRPTHLPWGVRFPADSFASLEFGNVAVHPAQLYFSALGFGLFTLLWSIRKRVATPGVLFWTFVALFAFLRIPLDLTRAYEPEAQAFTIGTTVVTESQITSLLVGLIALLMILRLRRAAGPAPGRAPGAA